MRISKTVSRLLLSILGSVLLSSVVWGQTMAPQPVVRVDLRENPVRFLRVEERWERDRDWRGRDWRREEWRERQWRAQRRREAEWRERQRRNAWWRHHRREEWRERDGRF